MRSEFPNKLLRDDTTVWSVRSVLPRHILPYCCHDLGSLVLRHRLTCFPSTHRPSPSTKATYIANHHVAIHLRGVADLQHKLYSCSRPQLFVHLTRVFENQSFLPLETLCCLSFFRANLSSSKKKKQCAMFIYIVQSSNTKKLLLKAIAVVD